METTPLFNKNYQSWLAIIHHNLKAFSDPVMEDDGRAEIMKLCLLSSTISTTKPPKAFRELQFFGDGDFNNKSRLTSKLRQVTAALDYVFVRYACNKLLFGASHAYGRYSRMSYSGHKSCEGLLASLDMEFVGGENAYYQFTWNHEQLTKLLKGSQLTMDVREYDSMRIYSDGNVTITDTEGVERLLIFVLKEKRKEARKNTSGNRSSLSGRMVDAQPKWVKGYPCRSGMYVAGTFGNEERDVLSRMGVPDSHTVVGGNVDNEATRVSENLYWFDKEALEKGKTPWQHHTGLYDNSITHYLDFEVSYE